MGTLESRIARLEAAVAGPAQVYVLSVGEHEDEDAVVARLLPDVRSADLVVILRRFADPDAPAELSRRLLT
jgi:hypothetical protein